MIYRSLCNPYPRRTHVELGLSGSSMQEQISIHHFQPQSRAERLTIKYHLEARWTGKELQSNKVMVVLPRIEKWE